MSKLINFPSTSEYPSYVSMYMKWVKQDGTLIDQLKSCQQEMEALVASLTEADLNHRYAPGKWTLKEVIVHLIDDERIYAYRALRFARNDATELPGFDQDLFTTHADVANRSVENIMQEYRAVRAATIALYESFSDEALLRSGTADGNRATVRALGYHILGHELHHMQIVKKKYLNQ